MELGELGKYLISSTLSAGITNDSAEDILFWCQINQEKYTDNDFPANLSSLISAPSSQKLKNWSKYRWLRISDIISDIEIFKEAVSPMDIIQGALADCNFLCSLAILCEYPNAIQKLFITKKQNQFGLYAVNLSKDGVWTDILIDDYFPCSASASVPVFSQCIKGEIWVMVLEKAWAKRVGCYENTEQMNLASCLHDLTGAPTREIPAESSSWDDLSQSKENNFIIAASSGQTKSSHKLLETVGLLGNISYAILKTADVGEKLIQLRNPWSKVEWNGDWSDNSDKWSGRMKKKLNYDGKEDGTFWMSFSDFCEYFSSITICEYKPENVHSFLTVSHELNGFVVVEIEVTRSDEYVLSINQKDKVTQQVFGEYDYSLVRIVICREGRRGTEYAMGKKGKNREVWARLALRRGRYRVFLMVDWVSNEREFVVSVYGPQSVQIYNLGQVEGFLENVYKGRSEEVPPVDYGREGYPGVFRYHEFLEEGFGYFYIKNSSEDIKLREKTYFKVFRNLKLLPPFKESSYEVTVDKGQDQIVIVKVLNDKDYRIESSSVYERIKST